MRRQDAIGAAFHGVLPTYVLPGLSGSVARRAPPRSRRQGTAYFPRQKSAKITSSRSSTSTRPVIRPRLRQASRRSSARNSGRSGGERAAQRVGRCPPAPRDAGRASAAARRCRSFRRRARPAPRPVRECPARSAPRPGSALRAISSPPSGERVGVRGTAARLSPGHRSRRPPSPAMRERGLLQREQIDLVRDQDRVRAGPRRRRPRRPAGATASNTNRRNSAASARASARRSPSCSISIGALAQPGGVGEHDRVAGEVDRDLDHVARRAGDRRGDRRLAPRELVQQARLAGVRRPDDRDRDAVAQPLAAMPVGQMRARSRRPAPRCPPRPCVSISGGRSSSGKSIAASRCARRRSSRSPQPRYSAPSAPSSWRNAWRRCASVSAAARSATASAWVRSSLPFRKARRVNSPGSARRSP